MKRRHISIVTGVFCFLALTVHVQGQNCLFVATNGNDATGTGTFSAPFKTIARAKQQVQVLKQSASGPIGVYIRAGTYYLDSALNFGVADGGTAASPITYSSYRGEKVILSGGIKVTSAWTSTTLNGITVQTTNIGANKNVDQLFLNGTRQVMARYPNFNASQYLQGSTTSSNVFNRVNSSASPTDGPGYIRTLHGSMWGGEDYIVTGKGSGSGQPPWQWVGDNNRGNTYNTTYMMCENISELLDTVREWYYKKSTGDLYFYPPSGTNMSTATIELASLEQLIKAVGTASTKIKYLTFNGLTFTQTHRTLFSGTFEGLLRGDWCIVREGAVFLQDAENITIKHCIFDQVGGNGVFMNAHNKNNLVYNNQFTNGGASCVACVGLQSACRDYSTWSNHKTTISDGTVGPLTQDYPDSCIISNNRMDSLGRFEKQTAGVHLSMSHAITVRHNTINVGPRAGINVNDGTWGGHIIEYNDISHVVQESGDHGPFNCWGRDRFWSYNGYCTDGCNGTAKRPYCELDAMSTTHIRNNRISDNNGLGSFGIDLDDGGTNYWIYKNLCLNCGIKLREGFDRKVYNNILVNGQLHYHCWYDDCRDTVLRNIVVNATSFDLQCNVDASTMPAKHALTDYNLYWNNGGSVTVAGLGTGQNTHSVTNQDPLFNNTGGGDYSVRSGSPALTLGFVNFPMDSFGRLNVAVDSLGSECATGVASEPVRPEPVLQLVSVRGDRVTVRYFLEMSERVEIDLLAMNGGKLASIAHGVEQPGMHAAVWVQKRQAGPGVFIVRLKLGDRIMAKKMVAIN
jgi:hypothetical protein